MSICECSTHDYEDAPCLLSPAIAPLPQFKDPYEAYLRQSSGDGDACGAFGLEYTFTLRETELNKNAVDEVPEWMLPLGALKVGQPATRIGDLKLNIVRSGVLLMPQKQVPVPGTTKYCRGKQAGSDGCNLLFYGSIHVLKRIR